MKSEALDFTGLIMIIVGAAFLIVSSIFFYDYAQKILAAGATGSTTSITNSLGIYNGTSNAPIYIGLTLFGLAFMIMGSVFVAGARIRESTSPPREYGTPQDIAPTPPIRQPVRACMKCGTLLYAETPYCPNCGSPLGRSSGPQT